MVFWEETIFSFPSIPSAIIPPGISNFSFPRVGRALAKTGQPVGGALSKQRYISDFKTRT